MSKRVSKKITNSLEVKKFLELKEEDITTSFIMNNFAAFDYKEPKYNTFDEIHIPKGAFTNGKFKNENEFDTTIGSWIFNKYFIEKDFIDLLGYIDDPISGKQYEKLDEKLTYALLEDDITLDQLKRFLEKTQLWMGYVSVLSPSVTEKLLLCEPVIAKEKKRLVKEYGDKLKGPGNEVYASEIEKKLLDFAADYLDQDPSLDCYNSKARMKWDNHFKNAYVMKGASSNVSGDGFDVLLSNYDSGFSKDEYANLANSLAEGPYSRGKMTAVGGYSELLFVRAFQHLKLDPPGSDCGTKRYIEVTIDNKEAYMYCYIIEGSNLVELTSKNIDKYMGKKVKMRFSSMCESKTGFCNHCFGNLPYRLGITNVGQAMAMIPGKVKLRAMKSFHDSNVKLAEIDLNKAFPD